MSAEQLMDAVVQVTGVEERFTGWPPGTRAMQIPHGSPAYLLTAFGRVADREFAQERKEDPSISQMLHLMNGDVLNAKIKSPEGTLSKWLASPDLDDVALVDRVFLTALARHATSREKATVLATLHGASAPARAQSFQDLLWALFNSKEFIYNH
jgi:hypothetical protein